LLWLESTQCSIIFGCMLVKPSQAGSRWNGQWVIAMEHFTMTNLLQLKGAHCWPLFFGRNWQWCGIVTNCERSATQGLYHPLLMCCVGYSNVQCQPCLQGYGALCSCHNQISVPSRLLIITEKTRDHWEAGSLPVSYWLRASNGKRSRLLAEHLPNVWMSWEACSVYFVNNMNPSCCGPHLQI